MWIIGLITAILAVLSSVYVVREYKAAVIERFGKFVKIAYPGLRIRIPFGIDKIAARISLSVQQQNITVETKTADNVFVTMELAVQYVIIGGKIYEAHYKLANPDVQIKAHVEDAMRSQVSSLKLDELFEKKDEISKEVLIIVHDAMDDYGYEILKTLIIDIEPDKAVKESMNEINAAQRKRAAAVELAEADKVKIVVAAEAEKKKAKLHGEGIADERKAIIDGLKYQFDTLDKSELTESQIMAVLLTEQYMDTLNEFAKNGKSTLLLPGSSTSGNDLFVQMLSALETANNAKTVVNKT